MKRTQASQRLILMCACGLAVAIASDASAGVVEGFYKRKNNATSRKAYLRAEERLTQVRIGMTQLEFFAAMHAEVLAGHRTTERGNRLEGSPLVRERHPKWRFADSRGGLPSRFLGSRSVTAGGK